MSERNEALRTMDVQYVHYLLIMIIALADVTRGDGSTGDGSLCFPDKFAFGVATASYQIEGAWNASGKSESIWDRYTHQHPERVFDHSSGDEADDSFHRYREDVALMQTLGVDFYRFSISWPRILPDGLSNNINHEGIRYYKELIEELHRKGIQPVVTMYHWDLPQSLQDLGGWTNPMLADYFVDYARVLFDNFGDKVTIWLTFNEPLSFCGDGYGGDDAPGRRASGFEDYLCGHTVLLAHGRVYRMYEKEYRRKQGGYIGITLSIDWMEPNSTSEADRNAAETANQFLFGWFAHPIYSKKGDYPAVMRKRVDEISRQQGFPRSRLPTFTSEEVKIIRGSFNFMGVNHYTTHMVTVGSGRVTPEPSFYDDMGLTLMQKEEWPTSNSSWLRVVPWGFRKALNWLKTTYDNPLMIITENGVSQEPGLHDPKRIQYISSYLKALQAAIVKDGCKVVGYTYWSLMDNFEWMRGYSERFGLFKVDYSSPNKTRTPRLSANFYTQVAKTKCIPEDYLNLIYTVDSV